MRVALILFLMALAAFAPVEAQEHPNVARGFTSSGTIATGDVDNVNLFNGNLVIHLPLGQSYPVNGGLSYRLNLVYNSQVWEHQTYDSLVQAIPSRVANAGLGWMVSLGRLNPPQFLGDFDTFRNTYMSPDGARHAFYPTLHEGETATAGIEYTRDGSYLRLNTSSREVEFPDGTIHSFDSNGFPTQIRDRFDNQVDICYSTACGADNNSWRISDSQGRVHWVYFKDGISVWQPEVVDRVDLAAFGGARAVYTFRYNIDDAQWMVLTGCRNSDPQTANHSVALLTSLSLPDGSVYSMPVADYFTATTTPCKAGMIRRLTLPTLGKIEWDYINYRFPTESTTRSFWQNTTGVGSRRLVHADGTVAGTWTYTTSPTTPTTELVNAVTDPLGHRTTRYFSVCATTTKCGGVTDRPYEYGLPLSRDQTGDGAGRFLSAQVVHQNGTLLRSTYVRYERDLAPGTNTTLEDKTRLNQRLASQRTVFHDDGNRAAGESFWDFDGLGHYRSHSTGGNFPGSNVRSSAVGYNPGQGTYGQAGYAMWPTGSPWVLGTYSFAWESEGGQLLYRSFCFDSATGFLTGRRVHVANDASYRANDLVEVFARDSAGNVTSEKYFGGDTQAITSDPTQGFICSLVQTLVSPTYQINHGYAFGVRSTTSTTVGGSTLFTLDQTIDRWTGLPNASQDTAGRQTTYSFDLLGRITQMLPPQGAATTYTWRPATSASSLARVTVAQTLSGVTYTESRTDFDGFGRPVVEEERMPDDSWADRRTAYNALGWKTSVSERDAPYATLFLDYDPFGRPGRIQPPDSAAHTVTLTYAGTSQVVRQTQVATSATGESPAGTTETYDRHGRLHQVTEPNGVITQYEYDAGNHLKRVCQGFNPANSTCGQERLFTFDNRGFLLWENHPEKTANSLGQGHDVDHLGYDAHGHATRKVDGANDLTFAYDKAERLTQIRQTGAGACGTVQGTGSLCLKGFTYATANGTATGGGTDYKRGKLVAASRYNYVGPPFNATVEVKESWQYAGRGGRMSQLDTALIFNGTQNEVFRQTFTWNEIGDLASHTYPDCATPERCGTAPRTQTYGYTRGRLSSVSGFASSITYHPSGMVARVVHSNGLTDLQSADPSGMARPAEISTIRTSDSLGLWSTGAYSYDGSGNVWKTGNALYLYDTLSRVVSGKVYSGPFSGGAANTQTCTYDNYGNLTSTTTNGTLINTPASTTTNRLTGGTYDAAGNLTAWSGNTYEYDAFDQMTRLVSSGEDWRYMYTAGDERFWSYRAAGAPGSVWTLRGPGGQVLREYNAHLGWDKYRDSIYRGGTLLATVASPASGGAVSHQHTDHLGTPRLITDAAGNPATKQYHAYYPYGQELTATYTTAYADRQRFTGHERDLVNPAGQGDDLDYMHARHYSPVVGRFVSFDPVGGSTGRPQSWNRYAYVLGNPLRYTDPQGLQPLQGYYYGQGIFAITGAYQFNTADRLFYGGESFFGLVGGAATSPHVFGGRDFASQVAANVWASTGWIAQAADEGARLFDLATGYISAVDALLLEGDPAEVGVRVAVALIPGPLDNGGLIVVNSGARIARSSSVKRAFLRLLASDTRTPSWMKQWLSRGNVPPGYNVEHRKPLSVGGIDAPSNMRLVLQKDHIIHHKFYHPWR